MPEHALRTVSSRPDGSDLRSKLGLRWFSRRSKMMVVTCAIAGAATLGACSPNQEIGLGTRALNTASQYLGTPYVYGGAQPGGFDCSGLTSYVYGKLGKYLPRTAEAQYEYVQKIPQSWAQKGDLIFFGSPGAIYHVGIYAGNGMMEHAPSTGSYVQIIPIWTSDYYVGRVQ